MKKERIDVASKEGKTSCLQVFGTGTLFAFLAFVGPIAGQTISYVQGAYSAPQSPQASVSVTYTAAQKAGDLNVVVVGWNDSTAVVNAISDSKGNLYSLALGPTIQTGIASQSVYYAKNILAATARGNTVTVTFSSAARYPDIRILEYSGADLANPVDAAVASVGTGTTSTSAAATTTNPTDLLVAANLVQTATTGAGTGFTKRLLTSPDGDIAEDRMVTSPGSYSATAPVSPSGQWIIQMVAFRTPVVTGGDTTPPSAPTGLAAAASGGIQANLSWTASTDNVAVAQYLVERCQGVGCSSFAQVGTSTTVSFSNTGLTNATAYSYRVRATDAAGNLSAYSNLASVVTLDTQAPTAPGSLTATPAGSTQINLTWTTSTDNVGVTQYFIERCIGTGCSNYAQVASSIAAGFNDTGLTAGTSYNYRVRATDAAGNLSSYSNSATATTPSTDTQAPTAPGSLTAIPAGSTQINLTWTASTDNVGVTQYFIERCIGTGCSNYAQVASSIAAGFNDTGLTAGTSYNYRVRATDAAGNLSSYSNSATATTPSTDTQAPTAPANLIATALGATQINLAWTPSTDNVGVTQYLVERCVGSGCSTFAQVGTSTSSAFSNTALTPSTTYSYRVRATDAAGNLSGYSSVASATTSTSSTTIAFVQVNSATPQTSQSTVAVPYLSAQKPADLNVVVVGWNDSTSTINTVSDASGNTYNLAVGPTIQSGVASQSIYYAKNIVAAGAGSNIVTVTFSAAARFVDIRILEYQGADLVNPVDTSAAAIGSGTSSNSGVATTTSPADLLVGANLVQTGTSGSGAGFTKRTITPGDADIAEDQMVSTVGLYSAIAPVSPSGQWIMQLVAFRAQGSGGGDLIPPTPPGNLIGTATSGSQASLSWTAATDNVGVWQYLVERCQGAGCVNFAQVATSPTTTFADTGLAASTSFSYRVRAMDLSGNMGAYSNVVSLNTLFAISPRVVVLTFSRIQQFSAGNASVTWLVDGTAGGSAATGTISTTGLYTPPASVGVHTVTAQGQSQSMSATVYITNFAGSFTRDYDKLRTGANLSESVLTPANVNSTQFGKLFSYALDGVANASPLYVANVNIPGQGFHNVIYVATEHDSVYAFDADGLSPNPLWKVSFINPAGGITTFSPSGDAGDCCPSDMVGEAGITGTPVIDPSTGTLYVSAETKEVSGATTNFVHRLHALDITSGAEKVGGPVVIQATIPGQGDGSSGGQLPFSPLHQNQRAALLLNNGVVYIAWAAHADQPPYHGWIMGYDASTLKQVMVYCSTPNGGQGGIWQSGDGLATDSTGRIYFVTGNGGFNVDQGGTEYGDTIAAINPDGTVSDYFTPHDQANMSALDLDLGSGGTLLLPDQPGPHPHEAISAGKNGTIYLVDRDNMGHYNPNNDNQIVQSLVNTFPGGTFTTGNFKAPLYFSGHLYFSADADTVKTFAVTNGLLSIGPTSQTSHIFNYPGSTLSISANGNTNGILWAIERINTDQRGNGAVAPGLLRAFDASNLATELYNSNQAPGGRDALDYTVKWSAPLVANGKVYVTTDGLLAVFGLLP